jgi:hypothetical protein
MKEACPANGTVYGPNLTGDIIANIVITIFLRMNGTHTEENISERFMEFIVLRKKGNVSYHERRKVCPKRKINF